MPARVDFSPGASSYDTRHGGLATAHASELASAAGLKAASELLEVGAGTGRVAIPFAALGFHVTALEPADGMLQLLREKAAALPVAVVRGAGSPVPFPDASFDGVLIARVLYVMPDWRDVLAEIRRVLKPGAPLLHEWGNGAPDEEWLEMREKARELFEGAGVVDPFHPGARTEAQVEEQLATLGFKMTAERRFAGDFNMQLGEFLSRIVTGKCSYTWNVPPAVQAETLPKLIAWAESRFDLERSVPLPREVVWKIYR
jgi:ubiquinone/menaquinone biosynthesis C-methylase UbiE